MENRSGQYRESESEEMPLVGIIMGSDTDLPVMQETAKILDDLKVSYEVRIISAHRTPDEMQEYAKNAHKRGIKVIVAGAGGAAHLPGMTAASTHLTVIGVPIQSKALRGLDSLLSIAQMPPGVPVSAMAIDGAINAGLTAASIIASSDEKLTERLIKYREDLSETVKQKDATLTNLGYREYLDKMES